MLDDHKTNIEKLTVALGDDNMNINQFNKYELINEYFQSRKG